jgi:chitin disaccharide deacetylase
MVAAWQSGPGGPETAAPGTRRIWLCADDYGISPAVNLAIRDLISRGRLNATSVMVVGPGLSSDEALGLRALAPRSGRTAVGLHLTLTAPFRPLTRGFVPQRQDAFPRLLSLIGLAMLRRLHPTSLAREISAQLAAFTKAFGSPPAFIDGHQHVHLLPQVREEVIAALKIRAPDCWVRQCGSATPFWERLLDRKAFLLSLLSRGLRRRAHAASIVVNPAFAGTYDFRPEADFATLFPSFLRGLPDGGVIMCHPGHVDEGLKRLDPLTHLREQEYQYLASEEFGRELARHRVSLY